MYIATTSWYYDYLVIGFASSISYYICIFFILSRSNKNVDIKPSARNSGNFTFYLLYVICGSTRALLLNCPLFSRFKKMKHRNHILSKVYRAIWFRWCLNFVSEGLCDYWNGNETWISNVVLTACFYDNIHQVRSQSNDLESQIIFLIAGNKIRIAKSC